MLSAMYGLMFFKRLERILLYTFAVVKKEPRDESCEESKEKYQRDDRIVFDPWNACDKMTFHCFVYLVPPPFQGGG